MNISDFYKYLENVQLLNSNTLHDIQEVVERYPYFQAARMLYLKNLHILNDDIFQSKLEENSIFFANRTALYKFINSYIVAANSIVTHDNNISTEDKPTLDNDSFTSDKNIEHTITNNISSEISNEENNEESIADKILKRIEQIKSSKTTQEIIAKPDEKSEIIKEEKIEDFSKQQQNLTFEDWLQFISKKTAFSETTQQKRSIEPDLIENFLENTNSLERIKPTNDDNNIDLTENLIQPEELEVVSENLAQLYYKQGYYEKALKLYEKLFLKYPEKSIYFASLIQEIKQKTDKN